MKLLCVPCDKPMQLGSTRGPERGSMTLVYACPECGWESALLTNAHETQLVGSLGVRIGPAEGGSKCPFTGIVREGEAAAMAAPTADGLPWSAGAAARLARLPEFVAPLVRAGVEQYARERGLAEVDERVLDEARGQLGP